MVIRPSRSEEILKRLPNNKELRGIEVGAKWGRNAKNLLLHRPLLILVLIDLWAEHPEDGSYRKSKDPNAKFSTEQYERFMRRAKRILKFAKDRTIFIKDDSVKASKLFEVRFQDFVFIDADHSYEGCRADIESYVPLIKKGGWIGGHDYAHPREKNGLWGVKRAVDEFANGREIELGRDYTWFIRL